jgi:protein-L-isoaspartate(D-aspartate) O-methyltransferase
MGQTVADSVFRPFFNRLQATKTMKTEIARQQMVSQQIRTWDVFEPNVLAAFNDIAREKFVPEDCVDVAYADTEIPLSHGQCMLRPSIVGRILQAIDLQSEDAVLEVGTGTGYLTACLAHLAASVTSIDIFEDFIAGAERNLQDAEVENVSLECMDGMSELPDGSFDVIIITSSVPQLDGAYVELLKPGGRLFIIVGESPAKTAMLVMRNPDDSYEYSELFETDVPQLINVELAAKFSF